LLVFGRFNYLFAIAYLERYITYLFIFLVFNDKNKYQYKLFVLKEQMW